MCLKAVLYRGFFPLRKILLLRIEIYCVIVSLARDDIMAKFWLFQNNYTYIKKKVVNNYLQSV